MSGDPENDPRVLRSRAAAETVGQGGAADAPAATSAKYPEIRAAMERLRARDSLVDRIIRDAQANGAFDNLPYTGQRLPLEDDSAAGDLASGFRILRNAGAAPEWIETDKEIRRLLEQRDAIFERAGRAGPLVRDRYRAQLRTLVADVNRLVFVLNHEAPTPAQHRRPLDLAQDLETLERQWPS